MYLHQPVEEAATKRSLAICGTFRFFRITCSSLIKRESKSSLFLQLSLSSLTLPYHIFYLPTHHDFPRYCYAGA